MRKLWAALLAAILVVPLLFQASAQAAVNISVVIDGVRLNTPQAPIMVQGRVMLPMRVIFEALDASVKWNQKTKTVTAEKDGTTVVLKINSKTATINGKNVALDVPARVMKGNTMVPVRFVSESLGEKIGWNSRTKTVTITTSGDSGIGLVPVSYVTLRDIGNSGDGRDLSVSFSKSSTESLVSHYRIYIVKQSRTLTVAQAQQLPSTAYTAVVPTGSDLSRTMTSSTRDIDGDLIRNNQPYKAYVLAVGNTSGNYALSAASPSLTLTNTNAVPAATNVKASDVSNYNDGRDLSVSFTRAQNEGSIANYRVFVVKSKDASAFNLAAAKAVPSQYYTTINKTSSSSTTLSATLSSSARDTSGELIRSGVAYTVFVQSVSSNENAAPSALSAGSSSITLSTGSTTVPSISQVTDVSDYNDGRDLRVSFNRVSNESAISAYRIFVVKESDYANFSLSRANNISSSNYTQVSKTSSTTLTLGSGARDVDGAYIRNGIYYRVFVMAVDNNSSSNNVLSAASSSIMLTSGSNVGTISNLAVSDVNNYNDGRDLQVSFNRPNNESNISHYQVYVVKANNANNFDLYRATNLSSYYYTQINKNNNSYITQTLNSNSRDVDGDLIRNGVSYRVFVLSAAYSGNHALSSASSAITLGSGSQNVNPVSTPTVADTGNNGNGSDLRVSFGAAYGESYIDHYRVFVVKSNKNLSLSDAVNRNYYYTYVGKGSNYTINLAGDARDTDGDRIQNGVSYRVYVLSVGNSSSNYSHALSSPSGAITLQGVTQVDAVTNVRAIDAGDEGNARDLKVSFTKARNEANIDGYRIFVVKQAKAASFKLEQAINVPSGRFEAAPKGYDFDYNLRDNITDTDGDAIRNLVDYQIFVMSVASGNVVNSALSAPSAVVRLTGTTVAVPGDVYAGIEGTSGNANDIVVRFTPATNAGTVKQYRIMVVPSTQRFGLGEANAVKDNFTAVSPATNPVDVRLEASAKDVNGNDIAAGQKYRVYVLVVADGTISTQNELSNSSEEFTIPNPVQTTGISAKLEQGKLQVDFKKAINETSVDAYRVLFVPKEKVKEFNLKQATEAAKTEDKNATFKPDGKDVSKLIELPSKDAYGKEIEVDKEYAVYVLSVLTTDKKKVTAAQSATPLSGPSKTLVLLAAPQQAPTTP